MRSAPRSIRTILSLFWLSLLLPVVVPHCDVVAQSLHAAITHSHSHATAETHSDHAQADPAHEPDQQCEIQSDVGTADVAAAKVDFKSKAGAFPAAGSFVSSAQISLVDAVLAQPHPPRWRHVDHFSPFQRNHHLLI